jgi:nucleoside-diphosphate-sugar epimerase
MRFTVFGAGGFVGGALTSYLQEAGHEVATPARDEIPVAGEDLGHVVYAIGLTGDFRTRPFDTADAHVTALVERLRYARFESWLYLSSTRVYGVGAGVASEDDDVRVRPDADGVYDLSKLLGEALVLSLPSGVARVARVANVFGSGAHRESFLGMLLDDIAAGRDLTIGESAASAKDYLAVDDLCRMIGHVAVHGQQRIYNVASGRPTTHGEIADVITRVTGRPVSFVADAPTRAFPRIDVSRVTAETSVSPARLVDRLPDLIAPLMPRETGRE